ncbi:MAG: type II toxin-antitoxin system RelE/ParE family toxin [Acidobacteriota bacterium]|nr:type II toxin-antitoxin system RelE/ParE family toxin [Acidobacteriota bacterium]
MIQSFGNASTEDFFHGRNTSAARRIPAVISQRLSDRLDVLNAATKLEAIAATPGARLEALKGRMKGWYSARINDQFRIVFRWTAMGPSDVAWTDYH